MRLSTDKQKLMEEIKQAYITRPDRPAYNRLSKEYGVYRSVLQRLGKKEDWYRQRDEYWRGVHTQALQVKQQTTAHTLAEIEAASLKAAHQMVITVGDTVTHALTQTASCDDPKICQSWARVLVSCATSIKTISEAIQNLKHDPGALNKLVEMVLGRA